MNAQSGERLQSIFHAVFELSPGTSVTELQQTNMPTWDSMRHVLLVAAIENEFGLHLDVADQLRMTGYPEISLLLTERGL